MCRTELESHFPDQGASPLALVAAPRADASFDDMNTAVAELERVAAEVPSVKVVPNPAQPAPQPDRPYVITLQMDFDKHRRGGRRQAAATEGRDRRQ